MGCSWFSILVEGDWITSLNMEREGGRINSVIKSLALGLNPEALIILVNDLNAVVEVPDAGPYRPGFEVSDR